MTTVDSLIRLVTTTYRTCFQQLFQALPKPKANQCVFFYRQVNAAIRALPQKHTVSQNVYSACVASPCFLQLYFFAHTILADIAVLAPGIHHTLLMRRDGSVWSTGINLDGRQKNFIEVIPNGATAAAVGNHYSIVLKEDDNVWATGKHSAAEGRLFFLTQQRLADMSFQLFRKSLARRLLSRAGITAWC